MTKRTVSYPRALREAHEKTARALAERECLRIAVHRPEQADAYLDEMHQRISTMVREAHREHGVKENMDALMLVYALTAFLERFDEITRSAGYPLQAANDGGRQ